MTSRNKHFYYYYLGDYSPGYTLVTEKTEWMLNSNFQNGVLALFKILNDVDDAKVDIKAIR